MITFKRLSLMSLLSVLSLSFLLSTAEAAPKKKAEKAEKAEDETEEVQKSDDFLDREGFNFETMLGLNILSTISNITNSESQISFLGGVSGNYFFTNRVGAFLGLQYTRRGYGNGVSSNSAGYMDIPFGFAFNISSQLFDNARNHFRLGGYLAVPISDYSGTASVSSAALLDATSFFGFYFDSVTHFKISETLTLGPAVWGKIGLGSASASTIVSTKAIELGLGVALGFF